MFAPIAPTDYSGAFTQQTPMQSAAQGYALGAGIRDDQQQQAALQQQQQLARQQQQDVNAVLRNPAATPSDFAALTLKYPAMKDSFKQANEMITSDQKEGVIRSATQVYAALSNGQPDIAKGLLDQEAKARENSGDAAGAQRLQFMSAAVSHDPVLTRNMIGLQLSHLDDKFAANVAGLNTDQRNQNEAPAVLATKKAEAVIKGAEAGIAPQKVLTDLQNTQSQINERSSMAADRAARLGLDRDKLTSETQIKVNELIQKAGELPEPVMKNINEATTNAIAARQSADQMMSLAGELEANPHLGYGTASSGLEWLKQKTGNQGSDTELRQQFTRLTTPAAMAAYKANAPGTFSDRDVETAMKGIPPDSADSKVMANYLRVVAKAQMVSSAMENAKSEWYASNKFLGPATKDIDVDGVKIPKGTTFPAFTKQYVEKKAGQLQGLSELGALDRKYGGGAIDPRFQGAPTTAGGN